MLVGGPGEPSRLKRRPWGKARGRMWDVLIDGQANGVLVLDSRISQALATTGNFPGEG